MKAGRVFTVIIGVAALNLIGYSIYINNRQADRNRTVIDSLFHSKEKLLFNDSIRSSIEKKIIDSVHQDLIKRDLRIRRVEIDIAKTRKQNEELQKMFNGASVDMPDY